MKETLGVTDGDGSITPVSTAADGGVVRLVAVPSPSCTHHYHNSMRRHTQQTCKALAWPLELPPQHLTPPDVVSAHVCCNPQEIAATLVNTSADGGVLRLVVVPSPSCTQQT